MCREMYVQKTVRKKDLEIEIEVKRFYMREIKQGRYYRLQKASVIQPSNRQLHKCLSPSQSIVKICFFIRRSDRQLLKFLVIWPSNRQPHLFLSSDQAFTSFTSSSFSSDHLLYNVFQLAKRSSAPQMSVSQLSDHLLHKCLVSQLSDHPLLKCLS